MMFLGAALLGGSVLVLLSLLIAKVCEASDRAKVAKKRLLISRRDVNSGRFRRRRGNRSPASKTNRGRAGASIISFWQN